MNISDQFGVNPDALKDQVAGVTQGCAYRVGPCRTQASLRTSSRQIQLQNETAGIYVPYNTKCTQMHEFAETASKAGRG